MQLRTAVHDKNMWGLTEMHDENKNIPELCSLMGLGYVCADCSFLADPECCEDYVFGRKLIRLFKESIEAAHKKGDDAAS